MDLAQLDINDNHWKRVFDFNKEDDSIPQPHWKIMTDSERKERIITIENDTQPENPCSIEATYYNYI